MLNLWRHCHPRGAGGLITLGFLLAMAIACAPSRDQDGAAGPPSGASEPSPERAALHEPAEDTSRDRHDSSDPPAAADLLPPLEGYVTSEAETGEIEASLDHDSFPYREIRRRLILDDEGFTRGGATVVTFEPESGRAERFLNHWYGDALRGPLEVGGVEMIRVEAEPHPVLAWTGPGFVVTFQRGAEADDDWLEELARNTVQEIHRTRARKFGSQP